MSQPEISVIIPVFNCERFLGQAIESVLAQEQSSLEVIVIDDGSTDSSAAVAAGFGGEVRYMSQTNRGIGAARNAGIELSRGRVLAFLDADDVWLPDKLRLQLDRLGRAPGLECIFGLVDQLYEPGESMGLEVRVPPGASGLVAGTMLITREAFSRVGPFSETVAIGEFIEWFARARAIGLRYEILQQVVMQRRIHAANLSRRHQADRSDYLRILRSNLELRRQRP